MDPASVMPGKSDGVTFSGYLLDGGNQHELLRRHWDKGEWEDHSFDLSAHAGKTITLRLQVEPGPKNNSSWDFSYFGNPKITVGKGADNRLALVGNLLRGKAWQATSQADMRALANSPAHGIIPSNLLPHRNSLQADANHWRFIYQGDDCRIEYLYQPATGTLDDFMARIDDGPPFHPAIGGGVGAGGLLSGGKPVSATRRDGELVVVWEYQVKSKPVRVEWIYQIRGKALQVTARCDSQVLDTFTLGQAAAPLRRQFEVPYLAGRAGFLVAQGAFIFRYLDWTKSNSSRCPQSGAV